MIFDDAMQAMFWISGDAISELIAIGIAAFIVVLMLSLFTRLFDMS
jgi:hypothetical protein